MWQEKKLRSSELEVILMSNTDDRASDFELTQTQMLMTCLSLSPEWKTAHNQFVAVTNPWEWI
jgi:hypothetical protein